ncbi:MAG: PDZ domain-containing protein [Gammaproteobacteria bacterium]|nr:PDZ domain-containing protein [Gammaproteobacteria bacterium]
MSNKYTVTLSNPHAHTFKVTLEISQPDTKGQIVSLPAWIPGSYMIRDFAKNIIEIHAKANEQPVTLTKLDKSSWQAEPVEQALTIEYTVYAWDLSVRTAHFDMTHAFFNGTSLFLMPHGFEHSSSVVELVSPTDPKYSDWHVTTSLRSQEVNSAGFGLYQASDYDDLIDHPVEIGTQSEFSFTVEDTEHSMALTGIQAADTERLKTDLTKICQAHCTMFGELPDIKEYKFLVMVTGDGYGGLEHRSSTSLLCSRNDLPLKTQPEDPEEKYRNFLGLCSHEYFHTWNVKRIKPEGFMPYDLTSETYTKQLWAFEGITSYYDELALVRCGVISVNSYLEMLGQNITRVLRGKGRFKQSIAESSFEAWTKFYKQDESAPNNIVSYYVKGGLLALCLDLTIRNHTNDTKSLDDVMRYLWNNYGKVSVGVPEGEIEKICSKISGHNLTNFFAHYLYGTDELPVEKLLSEFGIKYILRATTSVEDKGGKPLTTNKTTSPVSFGARFADDNRGAKIVQTFNNESAELAGLSAGDVVIAINRIQVNKSNIESIISNYSCGDEIQIHAFRRDELMTFNVKLITAEMTTCYLKIDDTPAEAVITKRNNWLFQ